MFDDIKSSNKQILDTINMKMDYIINHNLDANNNVADSKQHNKYRKRDLKRIVKSEIVSNSHDRDKSCTSKVSCIKPRIKLSRDEEIERELDIMIGPDHSESVRLTDGSNSQDQRLQESNLQQNEIDQTNSDNQSQQKNQASSKGKSDSDFGSLF